MKPGDVLRIKVDMLDAFTKDEMDKLLARDGYIYVVFQIEEDSRDPYPIITKSIASGAFVSFAEHEVEVAGE